MPTRKKIIVDGVSLSQAEPTAVPLDELYTWVVWQFPRQRDGGHSGAVHPAEPNHGWYPAIIDPAAGRVLVYAHLNERFATPETAAKHLDQLST